MINLHEDYTSNIFNDGTGRYTPSIGIYEEKPKEYERVSVKAPIGAVTKEVDISKEAPEEKIHPNLVGIPKSWEGIIHIISDEKFMALLDGNEYALYMGLKEISYNDKKGTHYLYMSQCGFSGLSEELQLKGNKNKSGEDTIVSRQSIKKLFDSLVRKNVLTKGTFEGQDVYWIMNEKNYKFTKVDNRLLKILTTTLKGQVIKTYIYIKACFENLEEGNKELFINRNTLAKAINEVNKKGKIEKRQLDNISMYITLLYNLNLIKSHMKIIQNTKGNVKSSCIVVTKVNDSLKDIPVKKRVA